jgi:hypothetical protein
MKVIANKDNHLKEAIRLAKNDDGRSADLQV